MKINRKGVMKGVFMAALCLSAFSCKNAFDLAPADALERSQAYQTVADADAAIMGLYGKVVGITDRYLVLNELRGDLEDVTQNADKYLREINDHNVSLNNPWANPKAYYDIIVNCNDVIANFKVMLDEKRMTQADYNIRISEAVALRCWLYLQVGIQYGSVPYVTDALQSIQDVQDESKFPKVTFDELIDKLIAEMEALPNKLLIPTSSLLTTIDGYSTLRIFVNKQVLLGTLYLYKGDYPNASHYLRQVLEYGEIISKPLDTDWYSIYTTGTNGGQSLSGGSWSRIFVDDYTARHTPYELVWGIPFNKNFAPGNPLIALYAPGPDKYKIKPSQFALDNWNNQTRRDRTPGDTYRGVSGKSFSMYNGQPYCFKVVPNYNPSSPFETTGRINMYRSAALQLQFSESANRDGRDKLAYAFMNAGLKTTYTPIGAGGDVTNIMQSFDTNPDYYFAARSGDNPRFREKWSYNQGLRFRVDLLNSIVDSTKYFDMSDKGSQTKPVIDRHGLTLAMEDLLLNEDALELAFEGYRWPDLIRIALRREKETPGSGRTFLRDKVAAKFIAAGLPVPAGVEKLAADVKNWYLPFKF
jgi:hypothetical protein